MQIIKSKLNDLFGNLEIYKELKDLITPSLKINIEDFEGCGLEVGGPSKIFRKAIPIYPKAKKIDFANFSNSTMWEGEIENLEPVSYYKNKIGKRLISEASELDFPVKKTYDFIISSNCLEHVANPIKALKRWKEVLKKDRKLLLILPNKDSSFDHLRPCTTIEHLIEDFTKNIGEDDLTHLEEILKLHDLKRDKPAGTFEEFRKRSLMNQVNRGLHHHVFNLKNINEMLEYSEFKVIENLSTKIDHIFVVSNY